MRYTVIWAPIAQNQLAQMWLEALDRSAISQSSDRIDELLATDPHKHGSNLREGLNKLQVYPLRVIFEIDDADCKVRVVRISLVG
jgi:mRNA-degrading endonuclease RelE of RelBE toxin-antitoxin system